MKRLFFGLLVCAALPVPAADEPPKRETKIQEMRVWLTNDFVPWLTNTFPEVVAKPWPEWLVNPPSKTRLPTWLTNTFEQIDTEEFPFWLETPDDEMLSKGLPDWWIDVVVKKIPVVPTPKKLPAIVRGPYLQMATTNSIVVRWRTDRPTPAELRYDRSLNKLDKRAKASGTLTENVVLVTNLQPDTKYYYSFGSRDTPIHVILTNNIARMSVTNSVLFVSAPHTNIQIAAVTNGTLMFSMRLGRLSIVSGDGKIIRHTTNTHLVVNTTNSLVNLWITNGVLAITTPDNIMPLDGGDWGPKAKKLTRRFLVGTTNVTFVPPDANTFFVTHPMIGRKRPTRVWVVGDPGTRKKEERAVRDAYYRWTGDRPTDLWLMLGDNAYTSGKDEEYQGGLFDVFEQMLRKSVLWPSLGNHDAGSANSRTQSGVYYDVFTLPTQGQSGGVLSGTEAYYSFDYANIHFVALDSADSDWDESALMVRWLKTDLALNQQDWLVVFCHHPPYTKGSHDSDKDKDSDARMRKMREVIVPILEAHGADLVLAGHSHAYERSFLLDGFYSNSTNVIERVHFKSTNDGRADGTGVYVKPTLGPAPREGAVYVVAGSSGQVSGGTLQHSAMCLSLNVLGSLVLDFDGPRLDATFIDDKAQVRDYFTILKGPRRERRPR